MRISDWSSDVCSSDLIGAPAQKHRRHSIRCRLFDDGGMYHILPAKGQGQFGTTGRKLYTCFAARRKQPAVQLAPPILGGVGRMNQEIGRASGRERVCQYV